MKKRAAVLCNGGTAPAWNAGLLGATECAEENGFEVFAIEDGYEGLITPGQQYRNIHECYRGDFKDLFYMPDTIIHASRVNPAPTDKPEVFDMYKDIIRKNLLENHIKFIIIFGGDDSIGAGLDLLEAGIVQANASPKTIDNDLTNTLSFGHMTASERGRECVEGMRGEARTYKDVAFIEAYGRDAGWHALQHSNADIILPAEMNIITEGQDKVRIGENFRVTKDYVVQKIIEAFKENGRRERNNDKKGNAVVVISEGTRIDGKQIFLSKDGEVDDHGHGRLGGARFIPEQWLKKEKMSTKQISLTYHNRFGPPIYDDARMSYELGWIAMKKAVKGKFGIVPVARGYRGQNTDGIRDMSEIRGGKTVPIDFYDFERLRSKVDTDTLLQY